MPDNRPTDASARRIDQDALTALGGELVHLAEGIRLTWQPAAERRGCEHLILELQAATASDNPGTLRSLARAVGECLMAADSSDDSVEDPPDPCPTCGSPARSIMPHDAPCPDPRHYGVTEGES